LDCRRREDGIPELRRTTRDEPDYDKLMRGRLAILDQHGLKLSDIQNVIGTLRPLPGGREFSGMTAFVGAGRHPVRHVRAIRHSLLRQFEFSTLLCHRLVVESDRS